MISLHWIFFVLIIVAYRNSNRISIFTYTVHCLVGFFNVYVVVNFLSQVFFIFPLFLGMVMYANEFKTNEK